MPAILFLLLQEALVVTVAPETYAEARAAVEEYFGIADVVVPVASADETFTIEDPFGESGAVVVVTDEKERALVGESKRWYRPQSKVVEWKVGEGLYRVRNGSDAATEPLRLAFHAFDKGRYVTGLIALETDGKPSDPVTLGGAAFNDEFVVVRRDGSRIRFGRFVTESAETSVAAARAESLKVGDRESALADLAPQGVARGGDAPALASQGAVKEGEETSVQMTGAAGAVAVRNDIPPPLLYAVAYEITDGGLREIMRTQAAQDRADVRAGEAGSVLKFSATYETDWKQAPALGEAAKRAMAALTERAPELRPYLPNADTYYRER